VTKKRNLTSAQI